MNKLELDSIFHSSISIFTARKLHNIGGKDCAARLCRGYSRPGVPNQASEWFASCNH